MIRVTLQPACVLHTRPYRESSLLVDAFTQEHGRITLVARGARGPRATLRSLLQPFNPVLISWQGRGELVTLTAAEANHAPVTLKADNLISGFYLNELLMRLLHRHDPHPQLYVAYQDTLLALQGERLQEGVLRIFEKRLLEEIGYGLPLQYEFNTSTAIAADQYYSYQHERGFVNSTPISEKNFSGKSLLALAAEELHDAEALRDAKRLMRMVLTPLLGNKSLQSRELFFKRTLEEE